MLSTIHGTINANVDNLRRDINKIFYQNNVDDLRAVVSSLALPVVSTMNYSTITVPSSTLVSSNLYSTIVAHSSVSNLYSTSSKMVSSNLYSTILSPINIEDMSQIFDINSDRQFKRICSKSCVCLSTNQVACDLNLFDLSGNCTKICP